MASGELQLQPVSERGRDEPTSVHSEIAVLRDRVAGLRVEVDRLRSELEERGQAVMRAEGRFHCFIEIGAAIHEHRSSDAFLDFIMERVCRIMAAERSTLYLVDDDTDELWSLVTTGSRTREIRLAPGAGIAGWVAKHGKSINVKDAYRDPRFDRSFDGVTGFRTRSVLCQPIRNAERRTIGVVQVLNKHRGYFTVEDEALLSSLCGQLAVTIENKRMVQALIEQNMELRRTEAQLTKRVRELDTLYGLQRRINEADDFDAIVRAIASAAARIIPARACAITLREEDRWVLYCVVREQDDERFVSSEIRRADDLRREIVRTRTTVRCGCEDTLEDDALEALGVTPRNAVAVPLIVNDEALGCIQLLNRMERGDDGEMLDFSEEEEKLLTLLAAQVSTVIGRSLAEKRRLTQERLSGLGQTLSGIVHDLKSPLTIVRGYVEMMRDEEDAEKRRDHTEQIVRQIDHVTKMTREVLAYARGESTMLARTVQMSSFVPEVRQLLGHEFEGRDVILDVETGYRGAAHFDEGKLKRILFNLARNAREAMPDGGRFSVRFDREGDHLVMRCADTGGGIPDRIRGRLFDAFVTDGKSGNSGLGLAIVKKLVEEHDGEIDFESVTGQGTTFVVRLPVRGPESSLELDAAGVPLEH